MPKHHDHTWLCLAFYLDRIEVYYCTYCLYANCLLAILGYVIIWVFSYIIALLYPGLFNNCDSYDPANWYPHSPDYLPDRF